MSEYSRLAVINQARAWVGKNEKDGSYREIIDVYNSVPAAILPRNLKMKYTWSWCAAFWSALAIKTGYTAIMPIEISCGNLQKLAANMGIWIESDNFIPDVGDAVLYDWEDDKNYAASDNHGWPDHIGIIEYVNPASGYMIVIEGNYSDSVKRRTLYINGRYIRGFITPRYTNAANIVIPNASVTNFSVKDIARNAIAGMYGNQPNRQKMIEDLGYNYKEVQAEINRILNGSAATTILPEQDQSQPVTKRVIGNGKATNLDKSYAGKYVTTADLYCRDAAGTNKKALCVIPKGVTVRNYGYLCKGSPYSWLYVEVVIDGVMYVGFCYDKYLKKI